MSVATEELEAGPSSCTPTSMRSQGHPRGHRQGVSGQALAHLTTEALLLKATTDVFKAQHDTLNQMKGNTQC